MQLQPLRVRIYVQDKDKVIKKILLDNIVTTVRRFKDASWDFATAVYQYQNHKRIDTDYIYKLFIEDDQTSYDGYATHFISTNEGSLDVVFEFYRIYYQDPK